MLRADNISHSYGSTRVLEDVSIEVARGKVLGLIGPNGSGKTTLLRSLYGAIHPRKGTVTLDGTNISGMTRRAIARRISVVVQEPQSEMAGSVADTVLMGRTPHRRLFQGSGARDEVLVAEALERVGALHLVDRGLDELSGGEKQRVLLARALVQEAECMLLDEPTNHLDIGYQHQLMQLVRELGLTTVVVLHDLNLAARYCDEVVLLERGRVRAAGTPEEVLSSEQVSPIYRIAAEDVAAHDGTGQLLFDRADVRVR